MDFLPGLIEPWLITETIAAEPYTCEYGENNSLFLDKNDITFPNSRAFADYAYWYQTKESFAAAHCNDKIDISFSTDYDDYKHFMANNFMGLGTYDHPFNGVISVGQNAGEVSIVLSTPLFKYVSDSVKIQGNSENATMKIVLSRQYYDSNNLKYMPSQVGNGECSPLFAEHVIHNGNQNTAPTWLVELSDGSGTYSGVIGVIEEGAVVNLNYTCNSTAAVVNNASGDTADVGAVVGRMESGASLTLSYSGSVPASITSANGNAGGIVGNAEGEATININEMPASLSANVTAATNAGGFIGYATSGATINVNNTGAIISGTIKSDGEEGAAGGIFGYYKNTKNYTGTEAFSPENYKLAVNGATVYAKYCGGIFGVLENSMNNGAATTFTLTVPQTITFDTQAQQNAQANALALSAQANNALDALN